MLSSLTLVRLGASWRDARRHAPHARAAMREFAITTRPRARMFLAQVMHECGSLRWMQELASGAEYEGRADLGNVHPGDGVRYKGRGVLQLTGRANYRRVGHALGVDLEGRPALAADPRIAWRIAGYFWKTNGLNQLADHGQFRSITYRVNGGYNGLANRLRLYKRTRLLGVTPGKGR